MKKIIMMLLVFAAVEQAAFAAPELVTVNPNAPSQKQKNYQEFVKKFPLDQVKDPAARQALAAIRDYLDPKEQVRQERVAAADKAARKKRMKQDFESSGNASKQL